MTMGTITVRALIIYALIIIASPLAAQTRGTTPIRVEQRAAVARTIQTLRALRGVDYRMATPGASLEKSGSRLQSTSGGGIAGTVTLPSGARGPASVIAMAADSMKEYYYLVDAADNGTYAIDDIPAGRYYVMAQATDCGLEFYDNTTSLDSATIVAVADGRITRGIDFSLEAIPVGEGSIAGKVLTDEGSDAIIGAEVYVMSLDNPFVGGWTQADASGDYVVDGLFAGSYIVQAVAPGFVGELYDNTVRFDEATPVVVTEPGTTRNINFSLGVGATITGRVVDGDGNPVAGVMINAMLDTRGSGDSADFSRGFGYAVTDEDGQYIMSGIEGGSYLVSASYWGPWMEVIEWYDNASSHETATPVNAANNATTSGIDFVLEIPTFDGFIRGIISDNAGNPLEGAYVSIQSSVDGPRFIYAGAVSGSDGSYIVEGLPDGQYIVGAVAQDGWKMSMKYWRDADSPEEADALLIYAGTPAVESVDISLDITRGTAEISGMVRLSDGTPAAGAAVGVMVVDPNDSTLLFGASAMTDGYGWYSIPYLPAGTYRVNATVWQDGKMGSEWYLNADNEMSATPVVLGDGEKRTDINFSLELVSYYGTVAGRVTDDATGAPIANAFIELQPSFDMPRAGGMGYMPTYAVTDAEGRYSIESVWAGDYYAVVVADGAYEYYDNATHPDDARLITVRGDATTTLNFGLTPRSHGSGSISGVVTSLDGQRINAAVIVAIPNDGTNEAFFPTVAQVSGAYRISGLADGDYYVQAYSPDHISEFYEDAWDFADATLVHVRNGAATTGIDFGLEAFRMVDRGDPAAPGAHAGGVRGKVTDLYQQPLADASVYVFDSNERPVASVRTKADGTYHISGIAPGDGYRVMASSVGYASEYNNDARRFEEATPMQIRRGSSEVNFALAPGTSSVRDRDINAGGISIAGAFPTPFTTTTTLQLSVARPLDVDVDVVDARGRTVVQLHDGVLVEGVHELRWNGRNADGKLQESGVYFVRVTNGRSVSTHAVTLVR